MNFEEIQKRFTDLSSVLQHDTPLIDKYFSTGERICINQERGSLFDNVNFLNGDLEEKQVRQLKVSKELNGRIEFVLTKIRNEKQK